MKILLVEDERPLAEVIRRGQARDGFTVDVLHDGQEAVWAATETGYEVVVLDIMLPGMNGYEVVERLRAREVLTPVLMLTALDDEYDQANAFDLGADDYLTKPFSFVVLAARLRALVRRGGPDRVAALTVGDLHLDPTTRRVHRGPQEVPLTTREWTYPSASRRSRPPAGPGTVLRRPDATPFPWLSRPGWDGPVRQSRM